MDALRGSPQDTMYGRQECCLKTAIQRAAGRILNSAGALSGGGFDSARPKFTSCSGGVSCSTLSEGGEDSGTK